MMWRKSGILYSLSSLGLSLVAFTFTTYVGFFYIDTVGLPPRWIGWGLFAFSWWNAINDPLMGIISDRTRTRWGRRIPYIAAASVPLGLFFALLWQPPAWDDPRVVYLWFFILVVLYDSAYSLVHLNVSALFPEMFHSLQERARVSTWRQWFNSVGLLAGSALTPILVQMWGWARVGITYGLVTVTTLLLSLLGSVEVAAYSRLGTLPLTQTVAVALRNGPFLLFLGILFALRMGLTLVIAVMPFYAKYNLHAGPGGLTWLLGVPIVSVLLLMPLWRRVVTFLGARRSLLAGALLTMAGTFPLALTDDLPVALGLLVLAGAGLGGLFVTPDILLADVVDYDFVLHGKRREGIFIGVSNFVTRLPNTVQALMVGEVLARSGYVAGVFQQTTSTIWGIRTLTGIVPALAMAALAVMAWKYPLDGERLARIKEEAKALRDQVEGMGREVPVDGLLVT